MPCLTLPQPSKFLLHRAVCEASTWGMGPVPEQPYWGCQSGFQKKLHAIHGQHKLCDIILFCCAGSLNQDPMRGVRNVEKPTLPSPCSLSVTSACKVCLISGTSLRRSVCLRPLRIMQFRNKSWWGEVLFWTSCLHKWKNCLGMRRPGAALAMWPWDGGVLDTERRKWDKKDHNL